MTNKTEQQICDDLNAECAIGQYLSLQLVQHVRRMGSTSSSGFVDHEGRTYVVSVAPNAANDRQGEDAQ